MATILIGWCVYKDVKIIIQINLNTSLKYIKWVKYRIENNGGGDENVSTFNRYNSVGLAVILYNNMIHTQIYLSNSIHFRKQTLWNRMLEPYTRK